MAATGCVKLDIESTADDHLEGSQADGRSYKVQLVPSVQMASRRYPQHWLQVTSLPCTLLLLVVLQALPFCTPSCHLPKFGELSWKLCFDANKSIRECIVPNTQHDVCMACRLMTSRPHVFVFEPASKFCQSAITCSSSRSQLDACEVSRWSCSHVAALEAQYVCSAELSDLMHLNNAAGKP